MFPYFRYLLLSIVLLLIGYFSWRTYLYFYDTTIPEVTIVGITDGGYYSKDIDLRIKGYSPYKVAYLSIWLDNSPVHSKIKINKKYVDYPILLSIKDLCDGQHTIKVEFIDGTKNQNKNFEEKVFSFDSLGLQAVLNISSADHKVLQGRCLHVQLQANKPMIEAKVKVLSGEYNCFPKSKNSILFEAFIPIDCEQLSQEYPFSVEVTDHVGNVVLLEDTFQIVSVAFKRKFLNVPNNKLKSELEFTSLQEKDLEEALDNATKNSAKEKLWVGAFDVPIAMMGISTEFGVIRTSQERGRTTHKALDITANPKSVIWASNSGVVVVKDRFNHSGNTVVLDHGKGILSLYFHLDDFADIAVGQKMKKGNPLGHMGMTGFANGPHLHWEIRVNNIAVDPMQWTQLVG